MNVNKFVLHLFLLVSTLFCLAVIAMCIREWSRQYYTDKNNKKSDWTREAYLHHIKLYRNDYLSELSPKLSSKGVTDTENIDDDFTYYFKLISEHDSIIYQQSHLLRSEDIVPPTKILFNEENPIPIERSKDKFRLVFMRDSTVLTDLPGFYFFDDDDDMRYQLQASYRKQLKFVSRDLKMLLYAEFNFR